MEWLHMDALIPVDEHRWIIFYLDKRNTPRTAEKALNHAGFEVNLVQDAIVEVPEVEGYKAFYGLVESTLTGVTPATLKADLGAPALLISEAPVSAFMEATLDAQEIAFGDHIVPTKFFKDYEKAPAGKWYMASAVWSSDALTMAQISEVLSQKGMLAYRPPNLPVSANRQNQQFLFSPGQKNPTIKAVRTALGATSLYINSYPYEGDLVWLKEFEGKSDEFLKAITEFGLETADVAVALVDTAKQAGKAAKQALTVTQWALVLVVPAAVLGGGLWAYSKYQETRSAV